MRSHVALVVVAALGCAACVRTLQSAEPRACRPPRPAGTASGIGIIGMSLDQQTGTNGSPELIVDRVVADGPAATAGIRPGDRILEIGGARTGDMSIAEAARRLRGPIDASVVLVIATGGQPRNVLITRVAPSDLWNGAAGAAAAAERKAERVRPSSVAPAAQVSAPPCRQ